MKQSWLLEQAGRAALERQIKSVCRVAGNRIVNSVCVDGESQWDFVLFFYEEISGTERRREDKVRGGSSS